MNVFNTSRMICGIIVALFIGWFLIPCARYKIINIGNATGVAAFLIIETYIIFMPLINRFIENSVRKTSGKIIFGVLGVFISFLILIIIVFSIFMITAANKKPVSNATVVVLGCKVSGNKASLMLEERLQTAFEYLNKNKEAKCVVSGGMGPGENITEAECMYNYLVDKGIDPDRIYKEDKSVSTRTNLSYSQKIIKDNDLNPEIAIVTHDFHEYRAGKIAEKLGLKYGAVSAKTVWWMFPTYYVRELYGIVYQFVK